MPNGINTNGVRLEKIYEVLERAAELVHDARGTNSVTSRDEMKAYLEANIPEGKERALADLFFRFVDHRDSGHGNRVTNTDIQSTLKYAKARLLRRLDANEDGVLSNQEIAGISRIGRLAVEIAREADRPAPPSICRVLGYGPIIDQAMSDGLVAIEGNPCNIDFARVTSDHNHHDVTELLTALFEVEGTDHIQRFNLGLISQWDGNDTYTDALAALRADGVKPKMREVFIGDFTADESEISWVDIGDVSDLYATAPNLESLKIKGGGIELGNLSAAEGLKSLELVSGGLTASAVRSVDAATLPKLEKLAMWFGAEEYGAGGTVDMLARLMRGDGLPALKDLGLQNAEFSDAIATALTTAPIVARLERLDLSMGTLTDAGAETLAQSAAHFAHLTEINVDDNYLTDAGIETLRRAFGDRVKIGTQDKFDPAYPDDRYVSVGE